MSRLFVLPLIILGLPPAAVAAAEDPVPPPVLVENYAYPGADRILAERGVRLVSGDGHVLLADCSTPGVVRIQSRAVAETCLDISGPVGYIAVEIPDTYLIRTDEHAIQATLSVNGQIRTVDLRPNEWNPVGEGADPNNRATLLSLKAQPADGSVPMLPVDAEHPFVGRVEFGQAGASGGMSRGCTATLVSPWWVLSAANCFAPDPERPVLAPGAPSLATTVSFGGHAAVALTYLQPRPERDVVLARLASPIRDVTPARLSDTVPSLSTELVTAGYGRTATAWRPDAQTKGRVTVTAVTDATLVGTTGPAGLCRGQAGGPVLSDGRVVAVHTRAGQSGCLDSAATRTDTVATRIDNLTSWITDTTRVWEGFTGGQEKWRDGMWFDNAKFVSGDWNGDGKEDLANLYKWNDTHAVIHTWTNTGGGMQFNYAVWNSQPGGHVWNNAKLVAGDWNGDGKDDLAILYKWDALHSVIHTWTSTGTGLQFNYGWWNSGPNSFAWDNAKLVAGDWNGDGKDDLAILYMWDGLHSVIHTWTSTGTGLTFNYAVWNSGPNSFAWHNAKFMAGDWNGDGKDDMAILYWYSATHSVIHTWTSTGTGLTYSTPVWDSGPGNFRWDSAKLIAGDWNGDGKEEPAVHYRVSDTQSELRAWTSTGTSLTYTNPALWRLNPDSAVPWTWEKAVPVAADLAGDRKDGLAVFVNNGSDNASMYAFTSFSTGASR